MIYCFLTLTTLSITETLEFLFQFANLLHRPAECVISPKVSFHPTWSISSHWCSRKKKKKIKKGKNSQQKKWRTLLQQKLQNASVGLLNEQHTGRQIVTTSSKSKRATLKTRLLQIQLYSATTMYWVLCIFFHNTLKYHSLHPPLEFIGCIGRF